jgi:DNA-binding CsgD family transcriptional regulator
VPLLAQAGSLLNGRLSRSRAYEQIKVILIKRIDRIDRSLRALLAQIGGFDYPCEPTICPWRRFMSTDLILAFVFAVLVAFVGIAARLIWHHFFRAPNDDLQTILRDLMETELDTREQRVLALRLGLYGERRSWTLDEIAARLGVSPERVRQIEENAMAKLQRGLTTRGMKGIDVTKMSKKRPR